MSNIRRINVDCYKLSNDLYIEVRKVLVGGNVRCLIKSRTMNESHFENHQAQSAQNSII